MKMVNLFGMASAHIVLPVFLNVLLEPLNMEKRQKARKDIYWIKQRDKKVRDNGKNKIGLYMRS